MIRRRGIPRNFTFFLLLLVVLAVHFALLRAGLILRNRASADATAGQIARSFLVGLRFDLATACYLLAPFAILAHIPGIAFDVSKRHRRIFLGVFTALMAVLTFTCLAEFEFFHEFQTRYNQVALQYLDQPVTVGGMAWYGYPVVRYTLIWLAWSAALSAAVWGLMRLTYRADSIKPHPAVDIGSIVALIAIFVLLMRGGFASEPLRWGDAYTTRSEFANQMSLNGLYTLGVTARNNLSGKNHSANWTRRMSLADARQIAREMVVEADETLIDAGDRTLLRRDSETRQWLTLARPASGRKPNVVIVLMESFSARFVGAVGAPGGLTPSIDAIARDGVLFKRAFSSGTHTHQGVFSTMLGFPNLPGYEYLMENYSGNQPFSALPSILRREGYQTLFIYNGNLAWDNMEGFFRKQGVDRFVGGKDFGKEIAQDRVWGVSDRDMLDRANEEFERAHKSGPFFGFVLTLSNHAPFDVPQPLPFPPTTGHGELNKRLDAMRYADWAIGQFIEKARGMAYFKDTLFVFVGDHGFHVPPRLTDVNLQYHHVPMIFYAPELLSQRGVVSDIVANHVNLAPSILGLLEVDPAAAHWGRNVFETDHFTEDHFAIFKGSGGTRAVAMARGEQLMVIGDDGKPRLYRYDLGFPPSVQRLDGPEHATTHSGMQRQIEGYVQSALADLASHNAGPEPQALEALSAPITDVR